MSAQQPAARDAKRRILAAARPALSENDYQKLAAEFERVDRERALQTAAVVADDESDDAMVTWARRRAAAGDAEAARYLRERAAESNDDRRSAQSSLRALARAELRRCAAERSKLTASTSSENNTCAGEGPSKG